MVCHCLLIETDEGLVLVDGGIGTGDIADPARLGPSWVREVSPRLDPAETALAQVRALGFRASDVRSLVMTHLDLDHAGSVPDFPHAKVHVHAREKSRRRRRTPAEGSSAGTCRGKSRPRSRALLRGRRRIVVRLRRRPCVEQSSRGPPLGTAAWSHRGALRRRGAREESLAAARRRLVPLPRPDGKRSPPRLWCSACSSAAPITESARARSKPGEAASPRARPPTRRDGVLRARPGQRWTGRSRLRLRDALRCGEARCGAPPSVRRATPMSRLAHGTPAPALRPSRFPLANDALRPRTRIAAGSTMAAPLRLLVPSAILALSAVACSAEDAATSAQDGGAPDASHDATNALADTACPGVEPDGAFNPPESPRVPGAGSRARRRLVPRRSAATRRRVLWRVLVLHGRGSMPSIRLDGVRGDRRLDVHVRVRCLVVLRHGLGDDACGGLPDASSPASADGSADG